MNVEAPHKGMWTKFFFLYYDKLCGWEWNPRGWWNCYVNDIKEKKKNLLPLGEAPLETLWERMMAIQPSTSTKASFLNSAKNKPDRQDWANRKES